MLAILPLPTKIPIAPKILNPNMKYIKQILPCIFLPLVSCSTDIKNWNMGDPNDGANLSADIMDARAYTSDSLGIERRSIENRMLPDSQRKSMRERESYLGLSRDF